jgi:hypothetical protein
VDKQRRHELWQAVTMKAATGSDWPHAVCDVARDVTASDAAITVRADSRIQDLLAASTPWVASLEEIQYTLGEGPGVEAFATGGPVLVHDLARYGDRWPLFTDAARSAGVASLFAFPLHVGAIFLGTLDLYRRDTGYLSLADLEVLTILADLATTVVLRHFAPGQGGHGDPVDLEGGSYEDVHIATGMLAAQLHIGLADASARLRAHAFGSGRSLLAVSRDVLAERIPLDQWVD